MPRSRRTMCSLATVSLVVLLSSSFGTTAVDASKTKNKALLQEKYGIDCGSHCTNAVVRLHEAKIEQEKCVGGFLLFSLESDLMMRDRRDFDLFLSRKKVSLRSLSPSLSRGETSPAVLVACSFVRSLFSRATSNENDTHVSRIPGCPFFFFKTHHRRLNHDKAVLSGAHDEAAVKQFLIEQAVVDSSELTNLGKSHTCVIERYSAYFPGQCVPTQAIMDYLSGKLVPEPNLDPSKDPVPYIPPTYGDVEAHRYEAVQALAAWLRLLPLDKLTSRVQYLLFPTELWDDGKLQKLQLYKAHVGKMGVNAREKLVAAKEALDKGDLEHGQLPRATRLKLTAHIRAARMIGYEIEGVDMEESDDSFAELLSEEIGLDDVSKGKMLEDRIRAQLKQLGQNVTEEDKLRIIQEAEEEAAIAPEMFEGKQNLGQAIGSILREHHEYVVRGTKAALKGQADARVVAYLLLTIIVVSVPVVAILLALQAHKEMLANQLLPKTWAEMIVPKKSTEDDLAEVVVKNEAKGTVKNVGYRPARQVPMMPSNTNTVAQQQPPPRKR